MPKGMLLAAGRGTRLGPLTESLPKPLLPVANVPVMAQGIQRLRRLGIRDVCVNVSYRASQIQDAFGDGHSQGVSLHWSVEDEPCGTAGGMKRVESHLAGDTVVLIAGDAMLDVDLEPLLAQHRAAGAFASLATLPVADPSQYGVVVADADHRIISFQEKPAPGTEISHQANTGIYIFEPGVFDLIPAGTFCDFALNVFPEILRRRLPFFAFPVEGYWTDIGNPGDYLQANLDYLAGRIRAEGHGRKVSGNLVAQDAQVAGVVLRDCIVGSGASLPRGTSLSACVVWPGTELAEPQRLQNAILTPWGTFMVEDKQAYPLAPAAAMA